MNEFQRAEGPTSSANESYNPDVIVVGGGLAGICAAIAATEHGSSVVVLDYLHGGGASAISGGVVYAGGGTKQQREAGYGEDTPENMLRYMRQEVGDAVDEATLKKFCDESVTRMEWLESHGVRFSGSMCPFRTSYPTNKYFLYFSGNEKAHPFATVAKPAPRGHRAVGKGSGGMAMTGGELWTALFDTAVRMGVIFRGASKVEELLLGSTGIVNGVRYRTIDEDSKAFAKHKQVAKKAAAYHAKSMHTIAERLDRQAKNIWERQAKAATLESRAVILAAGGYIMNKDITEKYIPWAHRVSPLGTAGDSGDGIQLGQALGGSLSHMDRVSAWRLMYPPEALVEGIVISTEGGRIAAEDLYGASFTDVMVQRYNGRGFLVLDSEQWKRVKSQIKVQTQMPWKALILYLIYWAHKKGSSLKSLALKLKVNPDLMMTTVGAYNDAIIDGKPDPVGKLGYRSVIATGPFYGIDISLKRSGLMVVPAMGLGGLRVDGRSGLVLTESGGEIKGLYAAGKNAAGISSNSYISGLALADCVFSGKRAGEHAAGL